MRDRPSRPRRTPTDVVAGAEHVAFRAQHTTTRIFGSVSLLTSASASAPYIASVNDSSWQVDREQRENSSVVRDLEVLGHFRCSFENWVPT